MAWITPIITWQDNYPINFAVTFGRIEGNIEYLKYLLR